VCTYADVAYLLMAYPEARVLTPGTWRVRVVSAAVGTYSVSLGVAPLELEVAVPGAGLTVLEIRDALFVAMANWGVPVEPFNSDSLLVSEAEPIGSSLAALFDNNVDATKIEAALARPTDNSESRAFWLEKTKCWVPACCNFSGCPADFTLYHAALAAHQIEVSAMAAQPGVLSGAVRKMSLGPAMIEFRGGSGSTEMSPTSSALSQTRAGLDILMLRRKYLSPWVTT
jgi:hypothetical protein